ncbi:MAG: YifB family Mg chelatase-like AAA ATPase [Verrucomicrobiales bacterium]|jgi:magnesium chelatase family protein|nr:YifB family Mg chelatase-like AAA ATPase [Verrucomicrobiales bacterium]
MFSQIKSASVVGVQAFPVEVEVNVGEIAAQGLPEFVVVGLPDAAVKESRDRVRTAVRNSAYNHPEGKVTVNLAPADLRKAGPSFDLPMALGILTASRQCQPPASREGRYLAVGELALTGAVRRVKGVLPIALLAKKLGFAALLVPEENAAEAAVVAGLRVFPVKNLRSAAEFLEGKAAINVALHRTNYFDADGGTDADLDFADVKGQESVKRSLEIAAAGGHNLLMIGPPGSGKSMLAKRLPGILPRMTLPESLETTRIHSVAGLLPAGQALVAARPFRSPHHTISDIGLIGGSAQLLPGEVSLAHNGVLFLDELPEFKRNALEVMRQPLEDGRVTITRAAGTVTFPARFMFVAAMNPTPTGSGNDAQKGRVSATAVQRYLNRISGPLLDRIDIHIEVAALKYEQLLAAPTGESSSVIRVRVEACRQIQRQRFAGKPIWCNAQMSPRQIQAFTPLDGESQNLLRYAMENLQLSARAYDRILKVARTIADLAGQEQVNAEHIGEAVQYRTLDRQIWG